MIFDKLSNNNLYHSVHPRFKKAFNYLLSTDFSTVEPGKYLIDGEELFASVQEYTAKEEIDCKLEAHNEYIDIQYIYKGKEQMGHALLYKQQPTETIEENDVIFFNDKCVNIEVNAGEFIIFHTHDLHKPCIKLNNELVKKVVVKVKIN